MNEWAIVFTALTSRHELEERDGPTLGGYSALENPPGMGLGFQPQRFKLWGSARGGDSLAEFAGF